MDGHTIRTAPNHFSLQVRIYKGVVQGTAYIDVRPMLLIWLYNLDLTMMACSKLYPAVVQ